MALLAGKVYDPSTAVSAVTTAALAMTAFDTTNLRLTFNAPSSGAVLVRIKACVHGATSCPQILLGVLESSTVVARQSPMPNNMGASANNRFGCEATFVVTGLTPGSSHTYDAAYGVEQLVASTAIKYGGPNNATTNDAWGGICFEIWDTDHLCQLSAGGVAAILYDPSTAATSSTASLQAMTAMDTTNLRLTNVIVPPTGNILFVVRGVGEGSATFPGPLLGVLEGATVIGRLAPQGGKFDMGGLAATTMVTWEAKFLATGLTPGTTHTYDAAVGVEIAQASTVIAWGGPNNTTAGDAWGGFAFEAWAA